jgi:hypothetical protein
MMEQAMNRMATSQDIKGVRLAWLDFISSVGRVFTKLEQGSKSSGRSGQWFGKIKQQRSTDPLLRYALHARNSHEHSIEAITGMSSREMVFDGPGPLAVLLFNEPLDDEAPLSSSVEQPSMMYWGYDGIMYSGMGTVIDVPPQLILVPVKDRGVLYGVPETHLGEPLIDDTPQSAAALLFAYCKALIDQAENLSG